MAEDGARASANPRADAQMTAAFDPVAWERRVNEARERRAQALAKRAVSGDAAPPPPPVLRGAASVARPQPRRSGAEFPRRDPSPAPDDPPPPFLGQSTPRDVEPEPRTANGTAEPPAPADPPVPDQVAPRAAEPEPQAAPLVKARPVAPEPPPFGTAPLVPGDPPPRSAPVAGQTASAGGEADRCPVVGRGIGGVMAAVFAGGLVLGLGLAFLFTSAGRSTPPVEATATATPPPAALVEIAAPPASATTPLVAPAPFTPAAAPREPAADLAAATPPPQPQPIAAQPAIATPPAVETPEPAAVPETTLPAVVTPPAPRDAAALSPAPTVATAPLAVRIVLHAPNGAVATRAETLAADLRAQGYDVTGPVAVDFAINRSNARYYHDADAEAASAFAAALSAASGQPAEPRDFTHAAARPVPGVLEVWLAGAPARPGRAAAPPPSPQQRASGALGGALRGLGRAVNDLDRRLQRGFSAITP